MTTDTLIKEAVQQTIDEAALYAPEFNWDEVQELSDGIELEENKKVAFLHNHKWLSVAASVILIALIATPLIMKFSQSPSEDIKTVDDKDKVTKTVPTTTATTTTSTTLPASSTTLPTSALQPTGENTSSNDNPPATDEPNVSILEAYNQDMLYDGPTSDAPQPQVYIKVDPPNARVSATLTFNIRNRESNVRITQTKVVTLGNSETFTIYPELYYGDALPISNCQTYELSVTISFGSTVFTTQSSTITTWATCP